MNGELRQTASNIKSKSGNIVRHHDISGLASIKPLKVAENKEKSPIIKNIVSYINGKPLRLFFMNRTEEMFDIIVKDNDVNLARTIVDSGLDNVPRLKMYLVKQVLMGIELKSVREKKLEVLRTLKAKDQISRIIKKKPNLIYSKVLQEL